LATKPIKRKKKKSFCSKIWKTKSIKFDGVEKWWRSVKEKVSANVNKQTNKQTSKGIKYVLNFFSKKIIE
jgi:hypothetical protein